MYIRTLRRTHISGNYQTLTMKRTLFWSVVAMIAFSACKKPENQVTQPTCDLNLNKINVNGFEFVPDTAYWSADTSSGHALITVIDDSTAGTIDGLLYVYFNRKPTGNAEYRIVSNTEYNAKFNGTENISYLYLGYNGNFYSINGSQKVKVMDAGTNLEVCYNRSPLKNAFDQSTVALHTMIKKR